MRANGFSGTGWARMRETHGRAGGGAAALFAWLSVAALFLISNLMLTRLGLAYETSGGAQWQKIAPATYLAFAALAAFLAAHPNLAALGDEIVRRHKGLIVFAFAWAMLFAYIVISHGSPLTAILDTFLLPMALFVVLPRLPERSQRTLALSLHVFMAANALLGLAEFATGWRLTPLVAEGLVLTSDYRSSALLGHPLNNATMTAGYALILMLGGGRDLRPGWRAALLLLQIAAMAVFGGRMATVLFLAFGGAIALWQGAALFKGRRFSLNAAAAAVLLGPLVVIAIAALVADGFLDKFIGRFVSDGGSAEARVRMFDLIGRIPFHELLVGADPATVATLQRTEGIAFGIESFWIAFLAYYGILISVPFFIGLLAFMREIWRAASPGAVWPLLFFLAVCSTSTSLASKTITFGQFAALVLLLMRPALFARGRAPC